MAKLDKNIADFCHIRK